MFEEEMGNTNLNKFSYIAVALQEAVTKVIGEERDKDEEKDWWRKWKEKQQDNENLSLWF